MEPEGSSPYTQEPATCPCPEPDQSSLRYPPNLSKIHFNIILRSTPGSSKWSPSQIKCKSPHNYVKVVSVTDKFVIINYISKYFKVYELKYLLLQSWSKLIFHTLVFSTDEKTVGHF